MSACASTSMPETQEASKPTAVDVMQNGGTYTYTKPKEPIYANSTKELQDQFMGRHIDELPEATTAHKAVQDPNEVVCEVVKRTSSRLRAKKVCAPRKEWDRHRAEARRLASQKQITRRVGD
jgi:hypothetical protein